jgi:DNA-binding MarR family transcriptional regulator
MQGVTTDTRSRTPELLTQRLIHLLRLLDNETRDTLGRECALRIIDWRVLASVADIDKITVRALAEKLYLSRSEVSRSAAVLAERGLVLREDDPNDGRSCFFLATEAGREIYRRVLPLRQDFMNRIISQFRPEERDVFYSVLDRLTEFLENTTGYKHE